MRRIRILVVDDEKLIRWSVSKTLRAMGHQVFEASDGDGALSSVEQHHPDIILLDIRMSGMNGFEVLKSVQANHPRIQVVMISAFGTMDTAVEAMRLGATDYLRKPFEPEELELLMKRLAEKEELRTDVAHLIGQRRSESDVSSIVGTSAAMQGVRSLVTTIAESGASSVLIEGESGTGKGLVARALHYASPRQERRFVEVSCTSLSEALVESELFGHQKGAFTDAKTTKKGLFELAHGGTLFLDEIGDMPMAAQSKLLRALEERTFKRVGGVEDIQVDIRVVAATNKNLTDAVANGEFRTDLFYRLAVMRVPVPPLRTRIEDVQPLCDHFVDHYNLEFRKQYGGVDDETIALMKAYRWPGNVRELRNVIERAMILGDGEMLRPKDLPSEFSSTQETERLKPHPTFDHKTGEEGAILEALEGANGNVSKAADALGISRDKLRYRMKKLGIAVRRIARG